MTGYRRRTTAALRIRAAVCVVVVSASAAALSGCSGPAPRSLLRSIDAGSVLLGTAFDQPGLSVRAPSGAMSGFDVDVATFVVEHIAAVRGRKGPQIKWRETPTAQREHLISGGEVDLVAATYSITRARAEQVDFAGPYLETRQGLLVRAADGAITSLGDLKNSTLCSVTGSTSTDRIKAQVPNAKLAEFDSEATCVDALRQGRVDAVTSDETVLAGFAARSPGVFRSVDAVAVRDACVGGTPQRAGDPLSIERYGIGLAKGDTASRDAVDDALRAMIDTGTWEKQLRSDLGDSTVKRIIDRATADDAFPPKVGDLAFLQAAPSACTSR